MESLEITNLIRSGQGNKAFDVLDKLSSDELQKIRNTAKSIAVKLKTNNPDKQVLLDKALLIKAIVNTRYGNETLKSTPVSRYINDVIMAINKRQN